VCRLPVALPVKSLIGYQAFWLDRRVIFAGISMVFAAGVGEIPTVGANECCRIGVEQNLVWVKAVALLGGIRPIHPPGIKATRSDALNPQVPDIPGAVGLMMQCYC